MTVMGGIFGLSFGYFTGDRSLLWSIAGTVIGALAGYLFGHYIDKAAARKK
jgi:outer membrane lipoprotein SlyB